MSGDKSRLATIAPSMRIRGDNGDVAEVLHRATVFFGIQGPGAR